MFFICLTLAISQPFATLIKQALDKHFFLTFVFHLSHICLTSVFFLLSITVQYNYFLLFIYTFSMQIPIFFYRFASSNEWNRI